LVRIKELRISDEMSEAQIDMVVNPCTGSALTVPNNIELWIPIDAEGPLLLWKRGEVMPPIPHNLAETYGGVLERMGYAWPYEDYWPTTFNTNV
jgi:hypothetical protein